MEEWHLCLCPVLFGADWSPRDSAQIWCFCCWYSLSLYCSRSFSGSISLMIHASHNLFLFLSHFVFTDTSTFPPQLKQFFFFFSLQYLDLYCSISTQMYCSDEVVVQPSEQSKMTIYNIKRLTWGLNQASDNEGNGLKSDIYLQNHSADWSLEEIK